MKKIIYFTLLLALASCCGNPYANAQEANTLSASVGYFEVFDDDGATDFRIEYTQGDALLFNHLKPWLGAEMTTDTTFWGGGGLALDIPAGNQLYVTPSLGVGFYAQGDSDVDLGDGLQLRPQVEVAYEFSNQNRLGLALSHFTDLSDDDESAQSLNVYYHVPVGRIFAGQ